MSGLVPSWPAQVAPTLNAKFGDKMGLEDQHALNGAGMFVPETFGTLTTRSISAMGARDVEEGVLVPEVSYTLNAGGQARMDIGNETVVPVAFDMAQITNKANRTRVEAGLPASTLNAAGQMHVAYGWRVRRLTPTECERLQGFPDGYTAISYRNKTADDCPDGPRYKALGNSMAVNAMRWIGQRIEMVDAMETAHG
jgi:DNA (cytosine-5)-methyltransferase 1